jgi:hypothetical protein
MLLVMKWPANEHKNPDNFDLNSNLVASYPQNIHLWSPHSSAYKLFVDVGVGDDC